MRSVSVWQPWASLLAQGAMRFDFKHFPLPAPYLGQELVLFAAPAPLREQELVELAERLQAAEESPDPLMRVYRRNAALDLLTRHIVDCETVFPRGAGIGVIRYAGSVRAAELFPDVAADLSPQLYAWSVEQAQAWPAPAYRRTHGYRGVFREWQEGCGE